jgi:hypothetical protein
MLRLRGCSSMAEFQPSKLAMRVRFPSPAQQMASSGTVPPACLSPPAFVFPRRGTAQTSSMPTGVHRRCATKTYSRLSSSNGSPANPPYRAWSSRPAASISPSHSFLVAHHSELVAPPSMTDVYPAVAHRVPRDKRNRLVLVPADRGGPRSCDRRRTRSTRTARPAAAPPQRARTSGAGRPTSARGEGP